MILNTMTSKVPHICSTSTHRSVIGYCRDISNISFRISHNVKFITFLALLDYVNRPHEIEICPSSVRASSVVRVAIISEPNARISFKFHLWLLLDYSQNHF